MGHEKDQQNGLCILDFSGILCVIIFQLKIPLSFYNFNRNGQHLIIGFWMWVSLSTHHKILKSKGQNELMGIFTKIFLLFVHIKLKISARHV